MLDIRYRSILTVALPMMLSGFIQSIIAITDAAFLSRHSKLAYDASGSAGLWYITMYMVFIGLSDGAQIAMAQKVGEKNQKGFVAVFQSNFVILFSAAVILTILVQLCMPTLMGYLVSNYELAQAVQSFLEIRSYSFWAATITLSIQAFSSRENNACAYCLIDCRNFKHCFRLFSSLWNRPLPSIGIGRSSHCFYRCRIFSNAFPLIYLDRREIEKTIPGLERAFGE